MSLRGDEWGESRRAVGDPRYHVTPERALFRSAPSSHERNTTGGSCWRIVIPAVEISFVGGCRFAWRRGSGRPSARWSGTRIMCLHIFAAASLPKEYRIKRFPGKSTVRVTMETIWSTLVFRSSTQRAAAASSRELAVPRIGTGSRPIDVSSNYPIYGLADFQAAPRSPHSSPGRETSPATRLALTDPNKRGPTGSRSRSWHGKSSPITFCLVSSAYLFAE